MSHKTRKPGVEGAHHGLAGSAAPLSAAVRGFLDGLAELIAGAILQEVGQGSTSDNENSLLTSTSQREP